MLEIVEDWRVKYYRFMNETAFSDGKYHKLYVGIIILVGLLIGVMITDWSAVVLTDPKTWTEVGFFITAYCLGVPCVVALSDRRGILGNVLGLASNIGEMLIFAYFGTMGMVLAGAYFGITHILAFYRWNAKKFTDENGKVNISGMETEQLVFTLLFGVIGLGSLIVFQDFFGFNISSENVNWLTIVIWVGNMLTFVISVTAQYLMLVGKKEAWTYWFSSNFINFFLNFMSGNIWFMARDVLYQVNAWLARYKWNILAYQSKASERQKQGKAPDEDSRLVPPGLVIHRWDKVFLQDESSRGGED